MGPVGSSCLNEAFGEHDGELGLCLAHFRGGIFHVSTVWRKTGNSSFMTASSVGKWLRILTALRSFEFSASMALVV